jgi:hypothetical protein
VLQGVSLLVCGMKVNQSVVMPNVVDRYLLVADAVICSEKCHMLIKTL